MQKKTLALLMTFSCFIIHGHDSEYSVFSCMPEDAKNQIPAALREEIDARWRKKQEEKIDKEIDEYFDGILLKEFEQSGSIETAVSVKEKRNVQALESRKSQVCRCSRYRWPWQYYDTETEVEKIDKVFKDEIEKQNLRYKDAAVKHAEKFKAIQQEVNVAYRQYKNKIKILKKIHKSVQQCHGDLNCHHDNGIFDRHLSLTYREDIINKVFINAVKSCEQRNIVKEDILAQIWEKDPLLIKYQADAKRYNNLINVELNPQLQELIETNQD